MGHAISRTKPSIVTFDLFAREPSIEVFCRGCGAAISDATPQPAHRQKRRTRFICPPFRQDLLAVMFLVSRFYSGLPLGRSRGCSTEMFQIEGLSLTDSSCISPCVFC